MNSAEAVVERERATAAFRLTGVAAIGAAPVDNPDFLDVLGVPDDVVAADELVEELRDLESGGADLQIVHEENGKTFASVAAESAVDPFLPAQNARQRIVAERRISAAQTTRK